LVNVPEQEEIMSTERGVDRSSPTPSRTSEALQGHRIAIVNMPIYSDVETNFLNNAIRGLTPVCERLYVIAGNFESKYGDNVHAIKIPKRRIRPGRPSLSQKIIDNLSSQAHIMIKLAAVSKKCDVVLFDVGEYRNLFSIFWGKLLRKTTVVFHHGGNKLLEGQLEYRVGAQRIIPYLQEFMLRICYLIVDYVLCLSPSIVQFGGLLRYKKKILFCKHFVETDLFVAKTAPTSKENLIGYFGRLSYKKGIMNFIESMPLILDRWQDVRFIIAGNGELLEALNSTIDSKGFGDKLTVLPWIPTDRYPEYLAKLKFFLLPSYEEGVPATLLEAMSCGVIPVVTAVGGIPDIVTDGKSGFIISDNRPSTIATGLVRALKSSDLDDISRNAVEFVCREYTLRSVVQRWQEILCRISPNRGRNELQSVGSCS
jgi:glycosyltransferase involved in cell wall biosynthesis